MSTDNQTSLTSSQTRPFPSDFKLGVGFAVILVLGGTVSPDIWWKMFMLTIESPKDKLWGTNPTPHIRHIDAI